MKKNNSVKAKSDDKRNALKAFCVSLGNYIKVKYPFFILAFILMLVRRK